MGASGAGQSGRADRHSGPGARPRLHPRPRRLTQHAPPPEHSGPAAHSRGSLCTRVLSVSAETGDRYHHTIHLWPPRHPSLLSVCLEKISRDLWVPRSPTPRRCMCLCVCFEKWTSCAQRHCNVMRTCMCT